MTKSTLLRSGIFFFFLATCALSLQATKSTAAPSRGLTLLNALQLPQCDTASTTTYYSPLAAAFSLMLEHPRGVQLTVSDIVEGGAAVKLSPASGIQGQVAGASFFSTKEESAELTLLEVHLASEGQHQLVIAPMGGQIAPLELAVMVGPTLPCLSSAAAAPQREPFKDLADYRWAEPSINLFTSARLLTPTSADQFNPSQGVSRGEFALTLAKYLRMKKPKQPIAFADVGMDRSDYDAIVAVAPFFDHGVSAPQTFSPQEKISRLQAVVTLARIIAAAGLAEAPDSSRAEAILSKRSLSTAVADENRAYLALAMKLGFTRDWPAASQPLQETLTRAELADLLLNVDFAFHFSDLQCVAPTASPVAGVQRIHLPAVLVAMPAWTEVCSTRQALAQGSAVTGEGTPAAVGALLGRRLPSVIVSIPQPGTEATRKKAKKFARHHKLSSTPPAAIISGVYLGQSGVPQIYEGFVRDQTASYRLGTSGLQRWLSRAKLKSSKGGVTNSGTRTQFVTRSATGQGEPGVCGVALNGPNVGPGGSTASNTWYCYIELWADFFDPNWGDYIFLVDLLRQDENDPENDRYAFAAQWNSRPEASDNFQCDDSGGWIFVGSKTCTAFVYSRAISMQNQTADTNPALGGWSGVPSVGPSNPSNLPTVPLRLPDASLFHGPTTSTGSVSQTVGGGISAGVSYGANGLSVSANVSESFSAGTSHSDITITDNSVTLHGQPTSNFPANTADWMEMFSPGAGFGYASWTAPALDARSAFDGINEIAVYEIGDQFNTEPFQASVFGTATGGTANLVFALGLPLGGFIEGIPIVDMQVTFAISPPTFASCSGSEILDIVTLGFANKPIICSHPGAGAMELDVPTGAPTTPGTLLVFGQEQQYGAPVDWLALNQQQSSFVTNAQPDLGLGLTPANCLSPILCAMQVSLVNPSAAPGTQGAVGVATNPTFVMDNGVLPYKAVAMAVSSITPNSGTPSGGTVVTINGIGFFNLDTVQFGSASLSSCATSSPPCFNVNSQGTQISLTTPAGSGGPVPVTLSNLYLATTLPSTFTYTSPPFQVTAVSVSVSPTSYTGTCPEKFTFAATITANGAGVVTYTWLRSDGAVSSPQTITFTGAGTQTVVATWTLSPAAFSGWEQLQIISPNSLLSNQANFALMCN